MEHTIKCKPKFYVLRSIPNQLGTVYQGTDCWKVWINVLTEFYKVFYYFTHNWRGLSFSHSNQRVQYTVVRISEPIYLFVYLFSSPTSNGIEVQAKNILAEWPTQG